MATLHRTVPSHRRRPHARDARYRRPLEGFVYDVERARCQCAAPEPLATVVADRLALLLREPGWLCEEYCQPGDDDYRQHLLYAAADGGFSVVSLVWKPGQRTPIHDHVAWCVVGVYEGEETETRYRLYQEAQQRFLVESGTRSAQPGDTTALVPPAENIHEVRNAGPELAISIHVYGADIRALGTSILQRFDDLERRPEQGAGRLASWRAAG